jgi:hypothetical protein
MDYEFNAFHWAAVRFVWNAEKAAVADAPPRNACN